ncbi:MAG: amidase family protein [Candidatus Magasanikbacteria bacterium]|nr:amidase family protein [Candidatus Magasanikbacteria bacterium]
MNKISIKQIHQDLLAKKISCENLIKNHLDEIEKLDGQIKAFLEVFKTEALLEAKKVDIKIKNGEPLRVLEGIPVAIKDNMLFEGHIASSGSKILENYVSPYTATAIKKLKEAGAIIIGRTNMDEFAMGSSTENSAYGVTRNPYDLKRVPGGSSGGSAAAVAASMSVISLGSDTGGSIRQPAAFCGVVGLKPTYGAVSRYGLMAMSSSLDQIGPFANNVEDAQILFSVIKGKDQKDATSKDFQDSKIKTIKGLKIGLPKEYFSKGLDKKVEKNILQTLELLKNSGAEVREVSLPNTGYALAAYYLIMPAEVSSNLARFDGIRFGLSLNKEVKDLTEVYKKSRALFQEVDCLITPTTPTTAFKIGEKSSDPLEMYLSDIYTVSVNLAGLPAISIPNGVIEGLPAGLQIIGKHFDEHNLFSIAKYIEEINK